MNAEIPAENHITSIEAFNILAPVACSISLESHFINPTFTAPPTIIKSPMKKNIVGHSIPERSLCISRFPVISRRSPAPNSATVAGSYPSFP